MIKLSRGLPDVQEYVLEALKPGSRIAQVIVLEVPLVELIVADELPRSTRGTGGFGSTG